jgi:hypothetical protein
MSNSDRRFVRLAVLLVLAASVVCTNAKSQESGSKELEWAREFLSTLYPEIRGHRYVMTARTSQPFDVPVGPMGNIRVQIGDFAPGTVIGAATVTNGVVSPVQPKQFINALFEFDKPGRLFTFSSDGPAVGKPEEFERVKQLVELHPEWTDAQDIAVLLKAGAPYGPEGKDKFLKVIPLDQLEKLIGKVTIVSAEFETVADHQQGYALLHWVVIAKVKSSDRGEGTYRMYFEPFKGALTNMDAVSP